MSAERTSGLPIALDPFGSGQEAPEPPPQTGYDWSYETYASEIATTCSGATRGETTVTDLGQILPWNTAFGCSASVSINDEPVVIFSMWKNSSQNQYGLWWFYPERGTAEYKFDVPWTGKAGAQFQLLPSKRFLMWDNNNRGAYTCDLDGSNMEQVIQNGTLVADSGHGASNHANYDGTFCRTSNESQSFDLIDANFNVVHKTSLPGGSFQWMYKMSKMPNGNYFVYGASAQRALYNSDFTSRLSNKRSPGAYFGYASSKATVYDDGKIYFSGCCHSSNVMSMLYSSPYTDYTSSLSIISQDRLVGHLMIPTRELIQIAKYHSSYVPRGNSILAINPSTNTMSTLWEDGKTKEMAAFAIPLTNGKILIPQRYDNSTLFTAKLVDLHTSKKFSENVITNPLFRTYE